MGVFLDIEPGFNSDIICRGTTYHVQTEDWGQANPFVVTRVFQAGSVVASLKTPYERIIHTVASAQPRQAIRLGMREQHQKILDQLVSGALFESRLK
ncbi:MAG: hypothetical protein IT289_12640 [Oligoflexia bacterium]|nr:hypothetical protein [Oligoflexia bacterium]